MRHCGSMPDGGATAEGEAEAEAEAEVEAEASVVVSAPEPRARGSPPRLQAASTPHVIIASAPEVRGRFIQQSLRRMVVSCLSAHAPRWVSMRPPPAPATEVP